MMRLQMTRRVANGREYSLINLQLNIENQLFPLILTTENQHVRVTGRFLEGVQWDRFQAVYATILRTPLQQRR